MVDHLQGDRERTVPLKWPVTGEKHVEDHAERKEIGTAVNRFAV
jgi:hypothetical protein